MLSVNQRGAIGMVRFSCQLRYFIGACCHFIFQRFRSELRGRPEHTTLISNATYSPWVVDEPFKKVYKIISDYSLLDRMRLYELWQLVYQLNHLPDHAIEVGCWRGGAGCLVAYRLAQSNKATKMFLCDTFYGVVKAGKQDTFYHGHEFSNTSEAMVISLSQRLSLNNITVLPGVFPDETGSQIKEISFKFAHIDVDVYQSAKDAFEWLLPRLVKGGIIVFDDYGSASTPGIRQYVDELQGSSDVVIIRNLNGQAVIVKR